MFDVIDFNPQLLVGIVSAILSVLFAKFPVVNAWFAGLSSEIKSAIMIGLLLLVSAVVYVLALNGVIQTTEPLTLWLLAKIFFAALVSNQATYTIMPESKIVTRIKDNRIV